MPPVSVLIKPASAQCNMSCSYCFYRDEAQKRSQYSYGFMSLQTLKNVIRRTMLPADNLVSYAYQGGEPTLAGLDFFRQAVLFQHKYNINNVPVDNSIQTNGLLLDDDWCRFLAENHFLVGLSVDGTQQIHDSLRPTASGEPTFERVCRAAERMAKFRVEYNILTVVTHRIAEQIRAVYRFYQKQGWNYQQYILCLDPLEDDRSAWSLSAEQYGQFLIELFDLWYADLQRGRQPYIRQFENYVSLAVGLLPESCDQRGTCSIQNVVEADGSVYPCDFYVLDEYRLGNLNSERLNAIRASSCAAGFAERSQNLDPDCKKCPYFRLCRGGCQRVRFWDSEAYHNQYCAGYQLFFAHSYEKIMAIGRQLAGGA